MHWTESQTPIEINESIFPKFVNESCGTTERFWYIKDEFINHSKNLLSNGKMFSCISATLINNKWISEAKQITDADVATFIKEMRLFYMKTESMSIYSFCTYMQKHVNNLHIQNFFKHMRESWEENLSRDANLYNNYNGPIKTNKQLIDTVLYSGSFHSQEKYKKRYKELLEYMDESLILMNAYNAMHSGYQMNQISRSIDKLSEDNLIIMLPDHLRHEWDDNFPYQVVK